jgi:15-cis-phytoene synthase
VSGRELDAAGIVDPTLRASYEHCRRLNAAHGKTYYLATLLLPPAKRPYVHALYGFARYADEIVDDPASPASAAEKAAQLERWSACFLRGEGDDSTLPAVHDTIRRWGIPLEHFRSFLDSMRMDLTVTEYATFADLMGYVYGSATVIGLQMVPILEPRSDAAYAYAADLGAGFQLVNFLRDVGEDLRRGRIYLPMESLALFGVTSEHLAAGVVDARIRRLLAFEIARTREILRAAAPGVRLLHPTSRDCVATALRLYGGILDAIEAADYQVLDRRVRVGRLTRARVALPALRRARSARRAAAADRPAATVDPTTPTSSASG